MLAVPSWWGNKIEVVTFPKVVGSFLSFDPGSVIEKREGCLLEIGRAHV